MPTLTEYGATSDNSYYTNGTSWANGIAGNSLVNNGATTTTTAAGLYWGGTAYITESFHSFDVSGITAGSTLTAATYAVGYSHLDHCNGQVEEIYAYDWGASIGTDDWRTGGTTGWLNTNLSTARVAYHTPSGGDGTTGYTDYTSDGTNLTTAIDSALADDDIFRIVVATNQMRSDSAPSPNNDYSTNYYTGNGTRPPRLVVDYTEGSTATYSGRGIGRGIARGVLRCLPTLDHWTRKKSGLLAPA